MHDNKYDRINTLASKEADRRSVADRVAAILADARPAGVAPSINPIHLSRQWRGGSNAH